MGLTGEKSPQGVLVDHTPGWARGALGALPPGTRATNTLKRRTRTRRSVVDLSRRVILVRHGELALKSHRVRARLMRTLTRRIEEALERAGVEGLVEQTHSRHLVEGSDLEGALAAVSRVFGITSLSITHVTPSDLSTLEAAAAAYAEKYWPQEARSFAVRARRTGNHPYSSQEVAVKTGSSVMRTIRSRHPDARVDLGSPDWTLFVEVRDKQAFFHHDRVQGPGGLPLGSQGRLVVWLTGEESTVAAWLMMRRGAQILPFYLPQVDPDLHPVVDPEKDHPAVRAHQALRAWGAPRHLHAVDLDAGVLRAAKTHEPSLVEIARAAIQSGLDLARQTRAHALVTPETRRVSWVARLPEVHQGGEIPTLRPLMGLDQATIARFLATIGTSNGESEQSKADLLEAGARGEG
jgi:tRNA uracil 4-sulfurtransferase